jgi:hypothetical protein
MRLLPTGMPFNCRIVGCLSRSCCLQCLADARALGQVSVRTLYTSHYGRPLSRANSLLHKKIGALAQSLRRRPQDTRRDFVLSTLRNAALCLGLIAGMSSSQATLIDVTSAVAWSCGTGSCGFEPGGDPDVERGRLAFQYVLESPDVDPDPLRGLFAGAITAFRMVVDQQTRPDLVFTLAGPSQISFVRYSVRVGLSLDVAAFDESGALGFGTFHLPVYVNFSSSYPSGNVNVLPDAAFWLNAYGYMGSGFGEGETDWGSNFSAVQVATVPEPSSLSLAGYACLLLLGGMRWRKPS